MYESLLMIHHAKEHMDYHQERIRKYHESMIPSRNSIILRVKKRLKDGILNFGGMPQRKPIIH